MNRTFILILHVISRRYSTQSNAERNRWLAAGSLVPQFSAGSEVEFYPELQNAATASASDVAKTGAAQRSTRRGTARRRTVGVVKIELGRICGAECLQAQIQIEPLGESNGLRESRIQVEIGRAGKVIPSHIAECIASRGSKA